MTETDTIDREKLQEAIAQRFVGLVSIKDEPKVRTSAGWAADDILVLLAAPALPAGLPDVERLRDAVTALHRWDVSLGWGAFNVIVAQLDAALEGSAR